MLSRSRWSDAIGCATLTLAVCLASNAAADDLKDYNKQIIAAGFEPLYPATDGLRPGLLYAEGPGPNGSTVQKPLCAAAFVTPNDPPANVTLVTVKAANTSDLSSTLSIDPAVTGGVADISATLKSAGVTDGSTSFGTPQTVSIPAQVSDKGVSREVLKACQEHLTPYLSGARPTRNLFLVVSTLSVGNIAYSVTRHC